MQSDRSSCADDFGGVQEALRAFVNYVYQDWLDARTGPDMAVEVLHVAQYFGCPRLTALCEVILVKGLKGGDAEDPGALRFAEASR